MTSQFRPTLNHYQILYNLSKRFMKMLQHRIIFKQKITGRINSLVLPSATYSPWEGDADFSQIFNVVRNSTLVDKFRLYELFTISKQLSTVPGDFLEIGVWRGGSGALLANSAKTMGKKIYLADTFSGVVKANFADTSYLGGEHADTSLGYVENFFTENKIMNYEILQGIFPEETKHMIENATFSLVHIDVDVYESGSDAWDFIQSRLSKGGVVIFDDYGFISCSGITKLVEELINNPRYIFIHNINGHAIFVRTS
jgi:O-methyltransferase